MGEIMNEFEIKWRNKYMEDEHISIPEELFDDFKEEIAQAQQRGRIEELEWLRDWIFDYADNMEDISLHIIKRIKKLQTERE